MLTGYGATTQRVRLVQDVFATPVGSVSLRLRGAATAVAPGEQARVDVLVGDDLVGSTVLDGTGELDLTVDVPGRLLAPVVDLDIVLNATTADGTVCAAAGVPPLEVEIDAAASTVTATELDVERADFSLFPQLLGGVLPVAIRPQGEDPFSGAVEASRLVAALQRVAAAPFDVQLVRPETLVADDRSGLLVGATAADATALGAPAMLSAIRPTTTGSTLEVTSQDPYAVLQVVEQEDQFVLALGSWAPDDKPAPLTVVRSVVEFATNPGWESLRGDLVIADSSTPPAAAQSSGGQTTEESTESEDEDDSFPVLWLVVGLAVVAQVALFWLLLRRRERQEAAAAGAGSTSDALLGSRTSTRAYLEDFEFREEHLTTDEPDPAPAPVPAKKAPVKKAPAKKTPAQKTPAKKAPGQQTPAKKVPAKKTAAKKTVTKRSPNAKKRP